MASSDVIGKDTILFLIQADHEMGALVSFERDWVTPIVSFDKEDKTLSSSPLPSSSRADLSASRPRIFAPVKGDLRGKLQKLDDPSALGSGDPLSLPRPPQLPSVPTSSAKGLDDLRRNSRTRDTGKERTEKDSR